jgi:signal transduction histidine kinase/CheY-like chemotaxis protein
MQTKPAATEQAVPVWPTPPSDAALLADILGPLRLMPYMAAFACLLLGFGEARDASWIPVGVFAGVGYAVGWAKSRSPRAGACALLIGLAAALVVTTLVYPESLVLAALGYAVLVAGMLLGATAGLATGGVALLLVGGLALLSPSAVGGATAFATAVSVAAAAFIVWAAVRPMHEARGWAWDNYERLVDTTGQLRDRQAELVALSKGLDAAYHRLERVSRELEEQRDLADAARRSKAQFAAMVSHELRTPLNLIIGFSEMIVLSPQAYAGEALPENYRGDVEAIYRNATHLSTLVDDVLDLAQIDASRLGLERTWADLGRIVEEAVGLVGAIFRDKGLQLRSQVGGLPPVYVDATRVREVFVNLLVNAARFTDRGGVSIRAVPANGDVEVSVTDTGIGIAPESLPLVFREFLTSAGAEGGERDRGFGLGLAICKRFVELNGGRIWVDSRVGEGTTFSFTLPTKEGAVPVDPEGWFGARRPVLTGAHVPTVVAVGSSDASLRVVQRYLDGYSVLGAATLEEANVLIDRERPQALILTEDDGATGAAPRDAEARTAFDIPTIRCPIRSVRHLARRLGAAAYLVKPVGSKELLAALDRLGPDVRSVLVVDDDPEMIRLVTRVLRSRRKRLDVRTAFNGRDALAAATARRPDAVILDLLMPGTDGYAVLTAMGSDPELAAVPVIVVTAKGLEEETTIVGRVEIARAAGLSVGEGMRCLRASLEALRPPTHDAPERSEERVA